MKKSKFTESQIIKALKENEQGCSVGEVSREMGIEEHILLLAQEVRWYGGRPYEAFKGTRGREP